MSADLQVQSVNGVDFKVADLSLAEAGRKQIRLAEHEMPGLVALREEYGAEKPLAGARIAGSIHMTVQTAVLIETLVDLGAEVRWASCNIFSTQDEATTLVSAGTGSVAAAAVPSRAAACSAEATVPPALVWRSQAAHPRKYTAMAAAVTAATEETTPGGHRLYHFHVAGVLPFPAIN